MEVDGEEALEGEVLEILDDTENSPEESSDQEEYLAEAVVRFWPKMRMGLLQIHCIHLQGTQQPQRLA